MGRILFLFHIYLLYLQYCDGVIFKTTTKRKMVSSVNIPGAELTKKILIEHTLIGDDEIIEIEFQNYQPGDTQIRKISNFPEVVQINIEDMNQYIGITFTNLSKINLINLDNNNLNYIHHEMFGTIQVKELQLGHNYISNIDDKSFGSDLAMLDLSCNELIRVRSEWFQNPERITELSFDGNKITELESKLFKDFTSLVKFSVNLNQIHRIGEEVFPHKKSFVWISLGYNNLTDLQPNIFPPGNISMKYLEIQFNKLTYLPKKFMQKINGLELTNIDGNPWSCPCYLNEIVPWIDWTYYGDKDWEWPVDQPDELRCLVVDSVRNNTCIERVHNELIAYHQKYADRRPTDRNKYCECTKEESDYECIYFF